MNTIRFYIFALTAFSLNVMGQSSQNSKGIAPLPAPAANEQVATFAGGCFWSMAEGFSELMGVTRVVAGFSGGHVKNPTYAQVCTRTTGHAEAVQVYYNPQQINYMTLVQAFFNLHDPTTLNRQGPDEGPEYRSVAFYRDANEKKILENVIASVNNSKHYSSPVVTELVLFKMMYAAENYHQDYYKHNLDDGYISNVSKPKVMKLRKAMPAKLKTEFRSKAI